MAKRVTKRLVKAKPKKRVKKRATVLPKVMSKLIGIALADMKKAEAARDKYIVDLSTWHTPAKIECELKTMSGVSMFNIEDAIAHSKQVCVLCAAGSVMEFSLNASTNRDLEPGHFPKNQMQLEAINYLREGDVLGAALRLGLLDYDDVSHYVDKDKFSKFDCEIPEYDRKIDNAGIRDMTNAYGMAETLTDWAEAQLEESE